MKNLISLLFAGAVLATAAFGQEASAPATEQQQVQTEQTKSTADKCRGKDCCKNMMAKKDKAAKKDKSKESAMSCCK